MNEINLNNSNINSVSSNLDNANDNKDNSSVYLSQIIDLCIEKNASDIHFREGGRIALRIDGEILFIENINTLTKSDTENMINEMLIDNEEYKNKLRNEKEIDFSYTYKNGVNFRVNIFYQRGKLAGVMRMVSKHILSLEEIGIPLNIKKLLSLKEGLILISGPAGSGKSTTLQSILNYINKNFIRHILTIENPIEYFFDDDKSMFTQREVGKDTISISNALQSVFREDANIVMIGEIKDNKTLDQALTLAETGHLVFSTMLTHNSEQTLEKIFSYYPQSLRLEIQDRLAENLLAILSQDLLNRADKRGLIAVFEFMLVNSSIKNIIKHNNLAQLRTAIESSADEGMITMKSYIYHLAQNALIDNNEVNDLIASED